MANQIDKLQKDLVIENLGNYSALSNAEKIKILDDIVSRSAVAATMTAVDPVMFVVDSVEISRKRVTHTSHIVRAFQNCVRLMFESSDPPKTAYELFKASKSGFPYCRKFFEYFSGVHQKTKKSVA